MSGGIGLISPAETGIHEAEPQSALSEITALEMNASPLFSLAVNMPVQKALPSADKPDCHEGL
jgi:hypothetical protein